MEMSKANVVFLGLCGSQAALGLQGCMWDLWPWGRGWGWPCSASLLALQGTATLLGERISVALCSALDESDYQTEYEEELPVIPKEAYADFQSTGTELDSDSVRCWTLPCLCPF